MKRQGHLIELAADPNNLRLAFLKAKRGKSASPKVRLFEANLDENLLSLRNQLLEGNVQVGDYHYFKIYEPKE